MDARKPRDVRYFYPRSPCGERPFEKFDGVIATKISIHALLAESDFGLQIGFQLVRGFLSTLSLRRATLLLCLIFRLFRLFLSTLSLRRATGKITNKRLDERISIHALLAESDASLDTLRMAPTAFLSTLSLRRATRLEPRVIPDACGFLSTLSLRRATRSSSRLFVIFPISIHALLAESDGIFCSVWMPG